MTLKLEEVWEDCCARKETYCHCTKVVGEPAHMVPVRATDGNKPGIWKIGLETIVAKDYGSPNKKFFDRTVFYLKNLIVCNNFF